MRIGINGFGRIGRALFRINMANPQFDVMVINDINPDPENVCYLLKYDSTYGRLDQDVYYQKPHIHANGHKARLYCQRSMAEVPWEEHGVDVIIDASGVKSNIAAAEELKGRGVKHVILTNAPDIDAPYASIIMGVNEQSLTTDDFLVSSSICDANAVVPALHLLNEAFGVEHGFITTLHPWLNYQNLLDGPSLSVSDPGHIYSTYVLGRASLNALIPKTTTVIKASSKILPWLDEKFMCFSYRTPTSIVSSADLSLKLSRSVTRESVADLFQQAAREQKWNVLFNSTEALTSVDFTGFPFSCCIDHRWIMVEVDSFLKLVLWYDNEWGYSCRVADLATYIASMYETTA